MTHETNTTSGTKDGARPPSYGTEQVAVRRPTDPVIQDLSSHIQLRVRFGVGSSGRYGESGMQFGYTLILALAAAIIACHAVPAASPAKEAEESALGETTLAATPSPAPAHRALDPMSPSTSTPGTLPDTSPVPSRHIPITLTDLKIVAFDSGYRPTDLSGDQSVGVDRHGEVYLANVRSGEVRQLTDDGHRKIQPVISGNLVAWTDQRRGIETTDNGSLTGQGFADDIFVLDLNTGEQRRITDTPAKRNSLQLSGYKLVWNDNRNEFGEHYTHYDIYAYDLEKDEEVAVAVAPGSQWLGAIHEDRVVWADNRNSPTLGTVQAGCSNCPDNRFDIYLYDFNTRKELVLDESRTNDATPDIHGRYIVWRGFDDEGHTTIHLYDIETGERRTLASSSLGGVDRPLVSGDFVAWTVGWSCDVGPVPADLSTGVFAHDLRTDEVQQLSNYVEPSITLD